MSRLRFARMTGETEDPTVFGLMGTSKARIGKKTNLFQSAYEDEVIVRARASETEIRQDFGNRMGMR